MYIKSRVYNDEVNTSNSFPFVMAIHEKVNEILESIPGVIVNKSLKATGEKQLLNCFRDDFYTNNNIPMRLKECLNKKIGDLYTSGLSYSYHWITAQGIDIVIILGVRSDVTVTHSSCIHNMHVFVDGRGVASDTLKNPQTLCYSYSSELNSVYLYKESFVDLIFGYNEDLSNFYFVFSFASQTLTDDRNWNHVSLPLQGGWSKTNNNNFYIFPGGIFSHEPGEYEMVTKTVSAMSSYITEFNTYKGDLYNNKIPLYDIDVFNNGKGYIDTLSNIYAINIPEVKYKSGELINLNGRNFIRVVDRRNNLVLADNYTTQCSYMEV